MPREGGEEAAGMFDDIVSLDDSLVRRGYDAGVRIGNVQGEEEGLQLGRLKGAEVGVRLALYGGRLEAMEVLARKHPGVFAKRATGAMEQLRSALELAEHSLLNPREQAGFDALESAESRLRTISSLLKFSQRPAEETPSLDF
ncbi:hypothetical protein T492DRAFT_612204 [Pavlovales sp. CCMP2436]|nr:hypothetical protein T492DRAFT_612204 [Pavlovales sp. CCMP2436]